MKIFSGVDDDIARIIDQRSVTGHPDTDAWVRNPFYSSVFTGLAAMPVLTNKIERIRMYRAMSKYPEVEWCLEEIADDFLHEDEEGNYITLQLPDGVEDLNDRRKEILQSEFNKYIELFKLKENSFNLMKRFLTEGEIAYENIINPEKPELGIIGVKYIPTEYYETLMNTETGRPMGIYFDRKQLENDLRNVLSMSCFGSQQIFNNMITTSYANYNKDTSIPILWPQLTYISSGDTSPDGLINFPVMEKCKQAYHQLALMEDAAVILRVTRAPERLLFNISTAGMPDKKAEQFLKDFVNKMKSKKVLTPTERDGVAGSNKTITQVYNPVSMLESYYFAKSNANDGTTVESVGSTANYEQIEDIEFFQRKLFKQFKVPFSRYKMPENTMERDESISYEEYAFSRMEIRNQRRFALGLKNGYITHLKLRGIWEKYHLKESYLNVSFVKPVLFDQYNTQKLLTAKMDTYKTIVDQEEFSKIDAMKRILKMTDEQIEQNFRNLIKEKMYVQLADWASDKLNEQGPKDFTFPIPLAGEETEEDDSGGNEGEGGGNAEEQAGNEPEEPAEAPEGETGGEEKEEPAQAQPPEGFGLG